MQDWLRTVELSPIGLIEIKSADPTQMGMNHQVLAYGYEFIGADVAIHIYDPNHPDDDTVWMRFSTADPQHTTPVTYSTGETILCFFRSLYAFVSPPPPPPPSKCFIATAAYGADAAVVSTLRAFRDQCLMTDSRGRTLVKLYERVSPPLAAIISKSRVLREVARKLIVSPASRVANRRLAARSGKGHKTENTRKN